MGGEFDMFKTVAGDLVDRQPGLNVRRGLRRLASPRQIAPIIGVAFMLFAMWLAVKSEPWNGSVTV